jgi:hypothetical protein
MVLYGFLKPPQGTYGFLSGFPPFDATFKGKQRDNVNKALTPLSAVPVEISSP